MINKRAVGSWYALIYDVFSIFLLIDMTCLITGGDGFIGGYVFRYLTARGQAVIATKAEEVDIANRLELFRYLESLEEVSVIVHCATSKRNDSFEYRDDTVQNNVSMFINLIEYVKRKGILFICLGSGSDVDREYWCSGMVEGGYIDMPPASSDVHGSSKNLVSMMLNHIDYNRVIGLRLFGIFGIGEDYKSKLIPNTAVKCLSAIPPVIYQDRCYDYIDVEDLARFVSGLIKREEIMPWVNTGTWKDFNFCRGEVTSILQIVKYIRDRVDPGLDIDIVKKGDGKAYGGSSERLNKEFPWFEFSSIEKGLDTQISYWLENKSVIDTIALERDEFFAHASAIGGK